MSDWYRFNDDEDDAQFIRDDYWAAPDEEAQWRADQAKKLELQKMLDQGQQPGPMFWPPEVFPPKEAPKFVPPPMQKTEPPAFIDEIMQFPWLKGKPAPEPVPAPVRAAPPQAVRDSGEAPPQPRQEPVPVPVPAPAAQQAPVPTPEPVPVPVPRPQALPPSEEVAKPATAPGGRIPTAAELADKSRPVGERFNNPFNMWYDKYAGQQGGIDPKISVTQYDAPAAFPSKLAGAAAAIRKMAQSPLYSGKSMTDLIQQWVGHGVSYAPIIEKATGISRNTPITPAFLKSDQGRLFLSTMARYETKWENASPLTDAEWKQAQNIAFSGKSAAPTAEGVVVPSARSETFKGSSGAIAPAALGTSARGLSSSMQERLGQLVAAAKAAGLNININSGFRPVERQKVLFENAVRKYGSEAAARKWVAPPGRSQHNFGNAVDLGFGSDAARRFAHDNAGKYGLKFPMGHEPWHIEVSETRGGAAFGGGTGAGAGVNLGTGADVSSVTHTDPSGDPTASPAWAEEMQRKIDRLQASANEGFGAPPPMQMPEPMPVPKRTAFDPPNFFPPQEIPWMQPIMPKPETETTVGGQTLRDLGAALRGAQNETLANAQPSAVEPEMTALETLGRLKDWLSGKLGREYNVPSVAENTSLENIGRTASGLGRAAVDLTKGAGHFGQGVGAGALQLPNWVLAPAAQGLAIGASTFPWMRTPAKWIAGTAMPAVEDFSRSLMGMSQSAAAGPAGGLGETFGRALAAGPIAGTIGVASEVFGPEIVDKMEQMGELPDLSIVTPAQATDLTNQAGKNIVQFDGNGYIIAKTAAGPVKMPGESIAALQWGGIAALGFMAAPGLARMAYKHTNRAGREVTSLKGDVPGQSEGMVRSTPFDYFKANTLSHIDPLKSIMERQIEAMNRNQNAGLDPMIAQRIADELHIYSTSGQDNLIGQAIETGKMETTHMEFKVERGSLEQLKNFANQNPEFRDYINALINLDEVNHNAGAAVRTLNQGTFPPTMAARQAALQRFPLRIRDEAGQVQDRASILQRISDIEQRNQGANFEGAARVYRDYVAEGRRHISQGHNAPVDPHLLAASTSGMPYTPVFYAETPLGRGVGKEGVWKSARAGEDPLASLHSELYQAMSHRMNNEAVWKYIEAVPDSPAFEPVPKGYNRDKTIDPDSFLTIDRHGVSYTFKADPMVVGMLSMEPAGLLGVTDAFLNAQKQFFQKATTNVFAPAFSFTSMIRTWRQHMITASSFNAPRTGIDRFKPWRLPGEFRRVGPVALAMEVPRMLGPKLAQAYAPAVEATAGFLNNSGLSKIVGGPRPVNWMARVLVGHNARMFNEEFAMWGGKNKSWIEAADERRSTIKAHIRRTNNPQLRSMLDALARVTRPMSDMWRGDNVFREMVDPQGNPITGPQRPTAAGRLVERFTGTNPAGPARTLGNAWADTWSDIANSPNTAWARLNRNAIDPTTGQKITMDKLAYLMRDLTGDPTNRGSRKYVPKSGFYNPHEGRSGGPRDLGFQADTLGQRIGVAASKKAGTAAGLFHTATPWAGTLIRSPGRTIAAMSTNPVRAATWLATTQMMPELAVYAWNRSAGANYLNYYMEGRTPWQTNNNTYLAVPGARPEDGIEIPDFQEGLPFRRALIMFMDQMFGRTPHTFDEQWSNYLKAFASTNIIPPSPPVVGAFAALMGGEISHDQVRQVYDFGPKDLNVQDNLIERVGRALVPILVDYETSFFRAWHADKGGDSFDRIGSGLKEMGAGLVGRMAGVRDVAQAAGYNYKFPAPATNELTTEMFSRRKTFNNLMKFFRENVTMKDKDTGFVMQGWSPGFFNQGDPETMKRFMPNLMLPFEFKTPGLPQTDPGVSKEYRLVMDTMKEIMDAKGIGWEGMMKMRGGYGRAINSMRNVSEGNVQTWLDDRGRQDEGGAAMIKQMRAEGVDTNRRNSVLGWLNSQRNKLDKEMFYFMKAAEQRIDERLRKEHPKALKPGEKFSLDMAHPYMDRKVWPFNNPNYGRFTGASGVLADAPDE